jgi:ribosomal protein S18 acetylase RimI-like enzyme
VYEEWLPWLQESNERNFRRKEQAFYLGHTEGRPVATTLFVCNQDTIGIYAVATLPEFRKKGIATAVMRHGIGELQRNQSRMVTLQTFKGSAAERLYTSLGFTTVFEAQLYQRN